MEQMSEVARASLLYDFYGELLTEKQRQVMALYHEENLSLAEIGEEFGISRQAVFDTLKKAEQALQSYEEKLGLVEKFVTTDKALQEIDERLDELAKRLTDAALKGEIYGIREFIRKIAGDL